MANMDGMDLPAAADLFIPTGLLDADTVSFLTALHARVRTPSVIFCLGGCRFMMWLSFQLFFWEEKDQKLE